MALEFAVDDRGGKELAGPGKREAAREYFERFVMLHPSEWAFVQERER